MLKNIMDKHRHFMKFNNRALFILDLVFKIALFVFLIPAFHRLLNSVIKLWGKSYITFGNIGSFFIYPPTILLLLLTALCLTIFLLFESSSIICYCQARGIHKNTSILRALFCGGLNTIRCIFTGRIALLFFAFLAYLVSNIPLLLGIILRLRLPEDTFIAASDGIFIKMLLLLVFVFLAFIFYRSLFVMHYCIIEHDTVSNALEHTKELLKNRHWKTSVSLMLYNILLLACFYIFYYVMLLVTAVFVFLFTDKALVIVVFLSVYPKVNFYIILLFSMIAFIVNMNIISTLYQSYRTEDYPLLDSDTALLQEKKLHKINERYRRILISILSIVLTFGCINLFDAIRSNSLYLNQVLPGIRITSHRGYSHVAPENTLPAIEKAIEAHADYAEIDIQQTKDGVIILLHDKSLYRTTGVNKYVWALDYDEIKDLDAGAWFHKDYEGTKIPTLEEVLEVSKGRIKLNIEIKTHSFELNLEENLVSLIEEYGFENQCIISSFNYNSLVKIKNLNPNIKTGYILSAAYGNFYEKEHIDFFSINHNFINKGVVQNVHRVGKEVHAWTVNSSSELERMKSLGVDNIITDNISLAKEILYSNETNRSFIQLLERMLQSRPVS